MNPDRNHFSSLCVPSALTHTRSSSEAPYLMETLVKTAVHAYSMKGTKLCDW